MNSKFLSYVPQLEGEDKLKQCAEFIEKANKIAIITGAGMSTDSGIPDFRSKEGIYSKKPKDIFSKHNFFMNPHQVYLFIKDYINIINVKPNEGHYCLTELEKMGKEVTIITQNIDGLHSRAGNSKVLEVHGTLNTATCQNPKCRKQYSIGEVIKDNGQFSYYCNCKKDKSRSNLIKPDCVFFGENIKYGEQIFKIVNNCDLLMVLGTSMVVHPVAILPQYIKAGVPIIVINKDATGIDQDRMSVVFHENIKDTLKNIIQYIGQGGDSYENR